MNFFLLFNPSWKLMEIFLLYLFIESSKNHRSIFGRRGPSSQLSYSGSMASAGGGTLKDLSHPGLNEALKSHNSVTFKLVKTGE